MGRLERPYLITLEPLLIGIALCSAVGIAFGVGMGLSRSVEWLSLPIFIILQAAPMAAIIPLITYMYGIGLTQGARGDHAGRAGDRDELLQGHPQHPPVAAADVPLVPGHAAPGGDEDRAAERRQA